MINLNWQEFVEKYKPIKNTFIKNASCDGHLFEDKDQLRDVPNDRIWTLIHNEIEDDMFITNGARIINAIGYIVTIESWIDDEIVEVRLEETDYIKEE